MSMLTDSRICPDCRAPLTPEATCTGCGLRLTGPLALELMRTMRYAADLVEQLRLPASAPVSLPAALPHVRSRDLPSAPTMRPAPPRRGLSSASVPAVLFGLGALCLLVAAVVFVVVAWGSLGLGARTSIMLGVTGTIGAIATVLTRRGLRGAAETFWLITAALVALDLTAAYAAGLLGFDTIPSRHAVAVVGAGLFLLGGGVGAWARSTPVRTLYGPAAVATFGALVLTAAEAWAAPHGAAATAASVVVLAVVAGLAVRHGLTVTGYGVAGVTVLSWLSLLLDALDRASATDSAHWYGELGGWPALAAAVLAAAATLLPRLPEVARMALAGPSLVAVIVFVVGPEHSADTSLLLGAGIVLGLAMINLVTSRVWSVPAALLAGCGLVPFAGLLLIRPLQTIAEVPAAAPAHRANLDLAVPAVHGDLSGWTAPVTAAVVALAALALTRWLAHGPRAVAIRTAGLIAPTVLGLGIVTALLETEPTLATAVLAWAIVLGLLGALASAVRGAWPVGAIIAAGYLGAAGLRLAAPSHLLSAALATALVAGLAVGYRRTAAGVELRALLATGTVVVAGFAAAHAPYLFGGDETASAITLALVASAMLLAAGPITRGPVERLCVESTALLAGLAATALPGDIEVTTIVLTLVGTAVAASSVLYRDREEVSWIGAGILAVATVLRIDHQVTLPELATGPAALLLLTAGVHRLLTDPRASSLHTLGSGLTLAILPTLVLALDEPVSTRALVVGALGAGLLAIGVAQRWSAPFLAGSAALAVLALRHLEPVAEAVPRWVSFGILGIALLLVAVTWEARRQDLATAGRYLGSLR